MVPWSVLILYNLISSVYFIYDLGCCIVQPSGKTGMLPSDLSIIDKVLNLSIYLSTPNHSNFNIRILNNATMSCHKIKDIF